MEWKKARYCTGLFLFILSLISSCLLKLWSEESYIGLPVTKMYTQKIVIWWMFTCKCTMYRESIVWILVNVLKMW